MIFRKSAYVVALMGALAGSVASEQVEDDIALLKLDDKVYWNRFLQNSASPTRQPTPRGPGPRPPTRAPTPQPPAELPSQSPSMEPTGSAPTPVGTLSFGVDFECRVRFEESETNDDPAQDDRLCADWNLNGRDMTKQTFQFKGGACPATTTASTAQDYQCLNQRTVATTGDNTVTMAFLYGDWFSQLNSNTLTYTGLSNSMLGFLPDGSTLNDANNYVAFLKTRVKLDTFFSLDDLDSPPTGLAVDTNYLTMFIFDGTDDNTIYQVNKWFYPGTFGTPPNSYRIFQRFGATELVSMEDDRFGFVGYSTTNNNQIRGQVDYKYDIKSNSGIATGDVETIKRELQFKPCGSGTFTTPQGQTPWNPFDCVRDNSVKDGCSASRADLEIQRGGSIEFSDELRNIQPFGAYEYQVLLVDTTVDFGTEIATRPSVTNRFDFCQSP